MLGPLRLDAGKPVPELRVVMYFTVKVDDRFRTNDCDRLRSMLQ